MFKKAKEMFKKAFSKVQGTVSNVICTVTVAAQNVLEGTVAEAYVDTGVKILIAVVIGALLLAGLYTLFNTNIMPTVSQKITGLFNYTGT